MDNDIEQRHYKCEKCDTVVAIVPVSNGTKFSKNIVFLCKSCYTMLNIAKEHSYRDNSFNSPEGFDSLFGNIFKK